jgi:pyrroline-5-carboxylate reductase
MSLKDKRIGFLGAGNMGEALIKGLVTAGIVPSTAIYATDVRGDRLDEIARQYGIQARRDNVALVREVDVIVLAIKPQTMAALVGEIAPAITRDKLLISIAAGVPTASIRALLGVDGRGQIRPETPEGAPARLIRVMPNTPALVLEGVTAIARADGLAPGDLDIASEIFGAVGRVVVLGEEQLDAVTGLSGSGPAYVAMVVEALADGGVKMGLDRATAMTLATQTVVGATRLLQHTGLHPGALKDMVSSPGGTTIAGVAALEAGGLRAALIAAVERATQRSRELGQGKT